MKFFLPPSATRNGRAIVANNHIITRKTIFIFDLFKPGIFFPDFLIVRIKYEAFFIGFSYIKD